MIIRYTGATDRMVRLTEDYQLARKANRKATNRPAGFRIIGGRMSDLPVTNGEVSRNWMDTAEHHMESAAFSAEREYWHIACHQLVVAAETAIKAAHIAGDTHVPRKHDIRVLLSTCPMPAVREAVYEVYDRNSLNEFSQYYYSQYPDGEDADQGNYLWCSQVAENIIRWVREALS